ncbi:MAG: hypothetical protein M2R45_01980 [Verrucomicrobia subdivision 3 bacterium]|nr:hypothetical protein [Limisphaerales bacterium]MCS1416153.1 hypothetical protein [Limisphaerales bacterium]
MNYRRMGDTIAQAVSYDTTAFSSDSAQLYAAFIWEMEDPVFNQRYIEDSSPLHPTLQSLLSSSQPSQWQGLQWKDCESPGTE